MSAPSLIDLDVLVQPIPGDKPAGELLADMTRMQLDDLRKEPDPLDPSTSGRKADWPQIVRITTDVLENKSKDLIVAVRLMEGLTKKDGLPGLRDGLRLIHRLVTECHDRLHPIPGEGETYDVWEGAMKWINDSSRGGQFPTSIYKIPLFTGQHGTFSFEDSLRPERKTEFEESIPTFKAETIRARYDMMLEVRKILEDMAKALDERMGSDVAPDFLSPETPGNIGNAIQAVTDFIAQVANRRGVSLSDSPEAKAEGESGESSEGGSTGGSSGPTGIASNREGLYRQLEQIAATLERIEPHSPVPLLLKRCVRLGVMPFQQLMREFIRETAILDELDRTLGVPKAE